MCACESCCTLQLPVGLRHPAVALVEMRELGTLRYLFWKVY